VVATRPAARSGRKETRHLGMGTAGRGQDDAGRELPRRAQDPRALVPVDEGDADVATFFYYLGARGRSRC